VHQNEFTIALKSYPETSERGLSNILNVNPNKLTEIIKAIIKTLYGFFFICALIEKINEASVPLMKQTL